MFGKKSSNVTMFAVILIGIAIVVVSKTGNLETVTKFLGNTQVQATPKPDTLAEIDLVNSYPDNPLKVMGINNTIMLYIYSGGATDEDIQRAITLQRMLFADELLAMNDQDSQLILTKNQLNDMEKRGSKLLEIGLKPPEFDDEDPDMCTVRISQYMAGNVQSDVDYTLVKRDDKWRIFRWDQVNSDGEGDGE